MTAERIREAVTAQPFVPFDLRLVDGRSFAIRHTDYVAVPPIQRPRDILVFSPMADNPDEYRTHRIDLALVIEFTTPSVAATA
jgi:hypothetical protein